MYATDLVRSIRNDVTALQQWYEDDQLLVQERMCYRETANQPYPNAPNFREPIIDDTVREKTDQEISMYYNASRMAIVAPLAQINPNDRTAIETGFDSYLRYIIKPRAKLEEGMDCKNSRGFAVFKQTRLYNKVLRQVLPDFITCDIRDILVPYRTKEVEHAERITHVLRKTPRQFDSWAKKLNIPQEKIDEAKATMDSDKERKTETQESSTDAINLDIMGVTTSGDSKQIVIWETYTYADEDVQISGYTISKGQRCVKLICPDASGLVLTAYPWIEEDGSPRSWPFVRAPFENRSTLWYDSRGGAHLCLDDQLEATGMRNARDIAIDFFARPMFRNESGENVNNVTFNPGSVLPKGVGYEQPPQIPNSFDFLINNNKITAGRRMSAGAISNYSANMASSRKLQKTATEVADSRDRDVKMSSTAVERFSDPIVDLFQMIYDDMARMKLSFPIITPGQDAQVFEPALYEHRIVLVSGASQRTLDPDVQVRASMGMVDWLAQYAQVLPVDMMQMVKTVLSYYDARLTAGWIPNEEAQLPINQRLDQLTEQIQLLAQGGKQLDGRMENVEKAVTTIPTQA